MHAVKKSFRKETKKIKQLLKTEFKIQIRIQNHFML